MFGRLQEGCAENCEHRMFATILALKGYSHVKNHNTLLTLQHAFKGILL